MGEITLVRHGQANSSAKTEDEYDNLSDLGREQARWLGAWMQAHDWRFDHVLSGTLRRQRDTAREMGHEPDQDARLNELEYYSLSAAAAETINLPVPTPEEFADHFPQLMAAWEREEIAGSETYLGFAARVREMMEEAAQPGRHILCVTSGGVIAMILHQLLDIGMHQFGNVAMPIYNTSVHRFLVMPDRTILTGFNAIPHLELPERAEARTYY